MTFFSLVQQVNINEKIKNDPDGAYQIGIVIGSYLPLVILVGIAYLLYYRAKKRKDNE